MPIVILARHGRTAANAAHVLAGRTPGVGLDELGREQATRAATRLVDLPLVEVASSPMQRCQETARLLVAGRGLRVAKDSRLNECDYGDWAGGKLADLAKEPLWKTVQAQPSAVRFPGGESMTEMFARAVGAVRDRDARLAATHGQDAVWLAVSHGDVIKAILADALGLHLDNFQRVIVDPASLSVVRYTPHRALVLTMNSSSGSLAHLGATTAPVLGGGAGPTTTTS